MLLAINAMDVANAITFIRAAVLPVMPLAIASVTTRTCYTLTALYRIYPEAARKISAAQAAERQRAVQSKTSAFNLWCQNHQELVDAITQQDGENSFFEQPEVDVITQISIK
uniref:hypothetical protein n=1 Tax=Escherichia coli TaxID=562 RepID=UPI001F16D300|nr:hypothetical protein [Escherichia coli]